MPGHVAGFKDFFPDSRFRYANDVVAGSQPDWIVDFMMRHCAYSCDV
jgi:hypothetical protein